MPRGFYKKQRAAEKYMRDVARHAGADQEIIRCPRCGHKVAEVLDGKIAWLPGSVGAPAVDMRSSGAGWTCQVPGVAGQPSRVVDTTEASFAITCRECGTETRWQRILHR